MFGRLTAVKQVSNAPKYKWECRCSCGNIVFVDKNKLTNGRTVSCGCKRKEKKVFLTGRTFGKLTVLGEVAEINGKRAWLCLCACGNKKVIKHSGLVSDKTQSCGCLSKQILAERNTTHGMANTYTYKKWQGMIRRTVYTDIPKNKCYKDITVCERWGSFENFVVDMGEAPEGYSLDRIDNKKGYELANCRWVPLERQASNTSRNVVLEVDGVICTVSEHARSRGLRPDLVFDRINKLGWDAIKAIKTPKRVKRGKG